MTDAPAPAPVLVEVLGPLRLLVDGAPAAVRGAKRRAAFGLLALAEGRTVTVDALVDALWPDEVPESGRQALHSVVSRLRGDLGPAAGRLETGPAGYRLALSPGELDLTRARRLLARARGIAGRDAGAAAALLREAHGLWRGPVLADLAHIAPVAASVEACAVLRREVTDALIATAVTAGEAEEVCGLAAASVAEDPLREPAVLLLMRALAATGQAPEALRVGRDYRSRLADEAGLDPTPALAELEREVAGGASGPVPARSRPRPVPATRLLGRAGEIAAVHRLLATERLVTVVGPGGVGKTRLAAEIAARTAGTPTVLPLAAVTDPVAVPHALAAALGLTVSSGDLLAACLAVLGDGEGLLVVDNCEHLLDAARDLVGEVLAACPRLSVLATSRERLGLAAEHSFRLVPLPLPGPGQDPAGVASVALFLDRARRVRPLTADGGDLDVVADIVRRLDGMPLAIELAAGRLSGFALPDLRDRLDRALDLLGGGAPAADARHRTLRDTVRWSYELLGADEQRLFRALSVFVDGTDVTTAERLATDLGLTGDPGGLLAHLVDASVLDADLSDGTRYRMLSTLRAFGRDRLAAAGEEADAAGHLVRWAVDLLGWVGRTLATADEPRADAVLRREMANLRAAWRTARDRGDVDAAAAMVGGLFDAVAYRDLLELRGWAEELAEDPALPGRAGAALALGIAAEAAYHRGDHASAEHRALAGLGLASGGDRLGAWACRSVLAVVALARGDLPRVVELSLAAAAAAPPGRENLGLAALATAYAGDLGTAREVNERGLAAARSPSMLAWGAYVAGEIESLAGERDAAEDRYRRAVELGRNSGATFLVAIAAVGLQTVRAAGGRTTEALAGYREVVDAFAGTGNWTHLWATLRDLARLLRSVGDGPTAAVLEAAADAAPDAPADARRTPGPPPPAGLPGRDAVLDLARAAIDAALARA
ncbi:AfsR/SARP family transcriptional regulator [Trujillonella humicola]|uniref:AfsR/SARP family transcriptional regulator n=1 Tax=Trujillonella humicola TaxID=3383699 RepID=UPI003906705E